MAWQARLVALPELENEEKGMAIAFIMRMNEADRELSVPQDQAVAVSTIRQFLISLGPGKEMSSHGSGKDKGGSKSGSPGANHKAPTRSVAFSDPTHTLFDYIPGIKGLTVNYGLPCLRTIIRDDEIPLESELRDDVCKELLNSLLKSLLRDTVSSSNEASKGLPMFQVFEKLIRRNPFTLPPVSVMAALASESESLVPVKGGEGSISLEAVEEMEGMSRSILQQNISHEAWLRIPSIVKGRIELQIQCRQHDNKLFIMGACELADNLNTDEAVRSKLHQVYKEAFAIWYKNAANGVMRPVKMLLSDGKWLMRVNLKIDTPFKAKMDITKITGSFTASPSYSLTPGTVLGTTHMLNAVRLLVSWLWEGTFRDITVAGITAALKSAREKDAEHVRSALSVAETVDANIEAQQQAKRQKTEA